MMKNAVKKSTKTHGLGSQRQGAQRWFPPSVPTPWSLSHTVLSSWRWAERWTGEPLLILVGGFEQNPSEKYELVSRDDEILNIIYILYIYIWKNTKCSKPPTRILLKRTTNTPFCKKNRGNHFKIVSTCFWGHPNWWTSGSGFIVFHGLGHVRWEIIIVILGVSFGG